MNALQKVVTVLALLAFWVAVFALLGFGVVLLLSFIVPGVVFTGKAIGAGVVLVVLCSCVKTTN